MINQVLEVSKKVPHRTKYEVLSKLMEEVGELAQEISIDQGYVKKNKGKDGIIGEAIDVIICALDIIYLENATISETQLILKLNDKVNKWYTNCLNLNNK